MKKIIIISSNCNWAGNSEPFKIFDLNGNKIKEIPNSDDKTVNIDVYYDSIKNENYILAGNYYFAKSYNYNNNSLYQKYSDESNGSHGIIIIYTNDDIIKLIDSGIDGIIRIWNFHSGLLLNKYEIGDNILFDHFSILGILNIFHILDELFFLLLKSYNSGRLSFLRLIRFLFLSF